MKNSDIVVQLVGKSKEFCYTFYMLLDRLQSNLLNGKPDDTLFSNLVNLNENKIEPNNAEKPGMVQNEALISQKDDDTSIGNSEGNPDNAPVIAPKEEAKELKPDDEAKKPARYNGYMLYYKSILGDLKKDHPTFGFTDMAKVVSSKWKALPPEKRREWNMKSNPVKYKKISKRRYEKADHVVRKRRKAPVEIVIEKPKPAISPLIPEREEIQLKLEVPNNISHNITECNKSIDCDPIVNQRAELKRKLLKESVEQHVEHKQAQQLLVPGSASSLF